MSRFLGLFSLCLSLLFTTLTITVLFPFLPFMVADFYPDKKEEDLGYYVGMIGSAFMIGRCVSSLPWGYLSDQFGRRMAMLVSGASCCVLSLLFGVCTSLEAAIVVRFVGGLLNPAAGVAKTIVPELCAPGQIARAMTVIGLAWGMGNVIGAGLGGVLCKPAEKYPTWFSPNSVFGTYPYLLPSLVVAVLNVLGMVAIYFFVPETLENRKGIKDLIDLVRRRMGRHKYTAFDEVEMQEKKEEEIHDNRVDMKVGLRLYLDGGVWGPIVLYALHSAADIMLIETLPVLSEASLKVGGLGLDSTSVGIILMAGGFGCMCCQLIVFPPLVKRFGSVVTFATSSLVTGLASIAFPYYAPFAENHTAIMAAAVATFIFRQITSIVSFTSNFMLINNSVGGQYRGRINGVAMMVGSLFKAIGPVTGTAMFAWSLSSNLPFINASFTFFIVAVLEIVVFIFSFFFLPRSLNQPK